MKIKFLIILFLVASNVADAQELDIPLRAMKDELERNMKELLLEGYERPLFTHYGMTDEVLFQASASLGALTKSNLMNNRTKTSVRVLVGSYEFNDESFDVPGSMGVSANMELPLPMGDDYEGIRRSYWSTTDMVYKGAAKKYKKNLETLAELKKELKDLPHRSFAPAKGVVYIPRSEQPLLKREEMENYIRTISSVFKKYHHIKSSSVNIFLVSGNHYLANSEGSFQKVPVKLISLNIPIQIKNEQGELVSDVISLLATDINELPTTEKMIQQVETLIQLLAELQSAPKLEEEYSGPALFVGSPVADLFEKRILSSEDRLIASNNVPPLKGFQFETKSTDSKIGKPTFAETVTIKATPKLKAFEGQPLLGAFDVDPEGIEPAEETIIVEKGIIKTIFNDRTLTQDGQQANGLGIQQGVIDVSSSYRNTLVELKSKLIAQAKKEGLEFGLMIQDFSSGQGGLPKVYRVWVKDGREELVQQAVVKPITTKDFKKMSDATAEREVHQWRSGFASNSIISFIVPQAILLEEVEAEVGRSISLKEEEYVSNPLKK